jgi:hypothetical protein
MPYCKATNVIKWSILPFLGSCGKKMHSTWPTKKKRTMSFLFIMTYLQLSKLVLKVITVCQPQLNKNISVVKFCNLYLTGHFSTLKRATKISGSLSNGMLCNAVR